MYSYIKGIVEEIYLDRIILENNGIGYEINVSSFTAQSVQKGKSAKIFTKLIVREDDMSLCGFASRKELEMFKLLLSINGVGAKAALSLLSISRINNLKYAIIMEDDKHLCRAPGIGKKTAGRIILELKDKIKTEEVTQGVDIQEGFEDVVPNNANLVGEALGALLALGYSEKEAESALKKVNKHESVENIIKECLRVLMG